MKACVKCNLTKPLGEFYRDPKCKGGHTYDCKACRRRRVMERKKANLPAVQAALRQYARRPEVRARCRAWKKEWNARHMGRIVEAQRDYRARNPEKYQARLAVSHAIRRGELSPQPCEVCGGKAEAHHHDYSKPLDVRWFCRPHHYEFFHREHQ